MSDHIHIDSDGNADIETDGTLHEVTADIAWQRLGIVNVVYVGVPDTGSNQWVLIDAGIPGTTKLIKNAVSDRFGENARPSGIVMTHGHFDHVGALKNLAEEWDVPIYAHQQELPYLNGATSYPEPDPSVGGGMMAMASRFYPRGPIDVSQWLQPLPADGKIPGMPGWRWIHTPGHTKGHVSLWHEANRTLIAGDAFITTDQESAYAVATQKMEIQGPPMYLTPDWDSARASVRELAALQPELVITGHGKALHGTEMREGLQALANNFDDIAVPESGKYVDNA